jgi:hypothetical protein
MSQRRARGLLRAVAVVVFAAVTPARAHGGAVVLRCPATAITVRAPVREDARVICEAAAVAIGFLAGQGLRTSVAFELAVVGTLRPPIGATAFGGYLRTENRAYLLASSRVAAHGMVFGLPYDRTLYRALAVHEIAHAVAAANFGIPQPSVEAEEYIAYVAMLATMPDPQRRQILERSGATLQSGLELNAAVYLLDPFRFGILAYLHFTGPDGGKAFLRDVLAGRALTEFAF